MQTWLEMIRERNKIKEIRRRMALGQNREPIKIEPILKRKRRERIVSYSNSSRIQKS